MWGAFRAAAGTWGRSGGAAATLRNGSTLSSIRCSGFASSRRLLMSSISKKESEEEIMRKGMNTFNDLFVEARDQIEMAVESKGTVYYDEDAKSAQEAVDDALKAFDELLSKISESKRAEVKRGTGLKLEQLKQELETTLHADDDHH